MDDNLDEYNVVVSRIRQQMMVRNPACIYPDSEKCGNCGTYRMCHDGIIEKCPNCGDDEYEKGVTPDVP